METWVDAWNDAASGKLQLVPSRSSKPRDIAVICMIKNEPVFLPTWLRHYRQWFDDEDIYILDNESDDNSTVGLTVNLEVVKCSGKYFDHFCIMDHAARKTAELLAAGYRAVLFTEADELVVSNHGLRQHMCRFTKAFTRTVCVDMYHKTSEEAPIKWDQPLAPQRKYGSPNPMMNKPLLVTVPVSWSVGFHNIAGTPDGIPTHSLDYERVDPDLFMFHIQGIDKPYYIQRKEWQNRLQTWKEEDAKNGLGWGSLKKTGKDLDDFYEQRGRTAVPLSDKFRAAYAVPPTKLPCREIM